MSQHQFHLMHVHQRHVKNPKAFVDKKHVVPFVYMLLYEPIRKTPSVISLILKMLSYILISINHCFSIDIFWKSTIKIPYINFKINHRRKFNTTKTRNNIKKNKNDFNDLDLPKFDFNIHTRIT